ncbi:MAG TPA: hypothetical protein VGU70_07380 [Methylobacterium sp.]|jgi:hypothetical protein|uniref:hypothetical protein n=1 Tax=Methylorubrum sp. B1-46 TaxID=2897334 RepID=UPI001E431E17|nr:hypothetical protein [Methylorubrum sp. B1-46]UGB23899.1 hypothetical protein LPC10_12965 [Methylorubrum sp. B1-46]HEV2542567.1 hypothetical protein [Methylobacterium sp.]
MRDEAIVMPIDRNELRAIEQLLRQAEERLEPIATFRQRTLLQMSLFELRRSLQAEEGEAAAPADTDGDEPDDRGA